MRWSSILQKIKSIFKKTPQVIAGVEDQSRVTEYSCVLDMPKGKDADLRQVKNLIIQNPWSTVAISPEIALSEETDGGKSLNVKFRVISVSKGKLIEEQIKVLLQEKD